MGTTVAGVEGARKLLSRMLLELGNNVAEAAGCSVTIVPDAAGARLLGN